jgi:hypothetical protein
VNRTWQEEEKGQDQVDEEVFIQTSFHVYRYWWKKDA